MPGDSENENRQKGPKIIPELKAVLQEELDHEWEIADSDSEPSLGGAKGESTQAVEPPKVLMSSL
jgi:hypothetical protein